MLIYNTFTVRHPKIDTAIKNVDKTYEGKYNSLLNIKEDGKCDIFLAWGNTAPKLKHFEKIKNKIHKLAANGHNYMRYK